MSFKVFKETTGGWKKNDRLPEFMDMYDALRDNPGSYAVTDMDRMHIHYLMRRTGVTVHTKVIPNGKVEVWIPKN